MTDSLSEPTTDLLPTHRKKKLEIVIEQAFAAKIMRLLEKHGATGYTIFPELHGRGRHGSRTPADISGVFENVMIVTVTGEERARRIMQAAHEAMKDRIGIVVMYDVEVVRDDHF